MGVVLFLLTAIVAWTLQAPLAALALGAALGVSFLMALDNVYEFLKERG